ncbi:UNVERIFIED_CONTAM: hypothetical protein Slati_0934200, partial [Sesamum latifolium]
IFKNPLTLIMDINKFNGTNYNDWLRNLRIVLDFENQGYVLDKPLPTALPEGSSPKEHLTFNKLLEDNRKVRSIILASMTNEIQKQYDRLDDAPSIMLRMKESLPPSYNPFIVNYNMNGLDKSNHELINMLVQFEATTHKSEPEVLVGEASTSKAKGKRVGRWKRNKGKGKAAVATASAGGAPVAPTGKGKGKVLERSRKLSKDEMILRLGDGKAVAAEAVGSFSLVISDLNGLYILQQSNLIVTAQHKHKVDNHENAQLWHARLGHISKNRIRKLVDSKSLEVDDLDHLPTCESCLKGKITKKPFVGKSAITNSLLDLIHIDIYGPLNTPARGGFSYFITFINDHSWYGYVYLMRYKSEAFERFKEYRLEVENQTGHKIKALRSDQGGEYLSGEFIDYLKENGILSQWTPPGMPQLNGATERFIGYLKETAGYYFYDPTEQKIFISRNAVILEKGFLSDSRRDELECVARRTVSSKKNIRPLQLHDRGISYALGDVLCFEKLWPQSLPE